MYKVGDKVRWTSKAAGILREKEGVIVEVVPAGMVPLRMGVNMGRPRREVSYIVSAVAVGTGCERRHSYWPRTFNLKRVEDAQDPPAVQP
jgi:hypothetical protein